MYYLLFFATCSKQSTSVLILQRQKYTSHDGKKSSSIFPNFMRILNVTSRILEIYWKRWPDRAKFEKYGECENISKLSVFMAAFAIWLCKDIVVMLKKGNCGTAMSVSCSLWRKNTDFYSGNVVQISLLMTTYSLSHPAI